MKAKILLIALAVMITGISYSQNNLNEDINKCEKKVIKQIKRKMQLIDMNDYMKVGDESLFVITCTVNKDNIVEVVKIQGINENLKKQVLQTLEEHPVECKSSEIDSPFSFTMRFILFPV